MFPIVLGRDLTEGVEGGTWLGISKSGKFGALTNIRSWVEVPQTCDLKKGRGSLISNFLMNEQTEPHSYLSAIEVDKSNYRPFNLLLGNMKNGGKLYYLNNADSDEVKELTKGKLAKFLTC